MVHIIIYYNHYITFFYRPNSYNVYNGAESASYLEPKIWEQIPAEIKNKDSLDGFKKEIIKWKPTECPCRICETFVPNLDFV